MSTIGVLALQGAFVEHVAMLQRLGADVRLVTLPEHLEQVDGLIIPGGESTTIGKLMVEWKLLEPLRSLGSSGFPIFGSCAGAIVLAKHAGREQPLLHLMDLSVARNAFGRQVDSFEAELNIPALGSEPFHGIFIRAPKLHPLSEDVEVLCRLQDGTVVATRQHNLLAVSFHAELTEDSRLHRYFLNSIVVTQGGDLRVAPPDQDRAVTAEI